MNAEEPHPDDESLLTRLIACDNALAAGTPPQKPSAGETPVELRPRLEGDLACIQVLRKVLPRRSTGATPGMPPSDGAPVAVPDLPFQELGRFHIRRRLGQGAFGVVFLASDPQLGREVDLKVPRPEALMTGELRERFVREARAAAGLDHPNLVAVYEAGSVGPLCYIASAYCPGITLSEWLKERTELPQERLAAELVATLADAVSHAHSRGVVHRDLKPSNVLLQGKRRDPVDANSTVKEPGVRQRSADTEMDFVPRITDFGLAKLIGEGTALQGDTVDTETRTGAVLGTPNYMAPEQASGKNKEIGPAADVYALGVILYELLTGSPPFRGESLLDTLEQVRTREPLPPGRLRAKLSRDLETICLKCLQKEPQQRYESAAALADDLRRFLAHEPIHARPIRAWERGIKWARRRPAVATLCMVSFLGPLVLAAVVLAYNSQLRLALDAKDKALEGEESQTRLAQENEWDARNFSYVSDMNLAQQDWASARIERLRELLLRHEPPPDAKDLRGFEWYYWKRLLDHSALRTLSSHEGEVNCVACSPDGKLLVSGNQSSNNGGKKWSVHLWNAATGDYKGLLGFVALPIHAVAFAEEGRTIAVASGNSVKLFDRERSKPPWTLTNRGTNVTALAVAEHRQTMAVARFGLVEIWDLKKKTRLATLRRHQAAVHALAFSSDNRMLASGDALGIIHLWDLPAFQWRTSHTSPRNPINGVAFAPDGKLLAAACNDATVRLWDLDQGKELAVLTGHSKQVLSVQFTPDSRQLVSAGADATVRLWDSDGRPRLVLKGHTGEVRSAIFLPNGCTIVSASSDGTLKLWDVRRNPEHFSWDCHDEGVLQLAFTPDGSVLATGGADGYVKLWQPATGRYVATLPPYPRDSPRTIAGFGGLTGRMVAIGPPPPRPIQGLAFTPDGKHLAVACLDLCVHIWDHDQAKKVAVLKGHTHEVSAIALNADGTLLASGDMSGRVRIWDWQQRKTMAVCVGHKDGIRALAFSPAGKLLASGSMDGTIKLWEPETAQERRTLKGHESIVSGLSFSPDGHSLASGGEDGKVCLWAVDTGDLKKRLHGHLGPVRSLAFSSDGLTLASTSGEVKLWHVLTGRELATFALPGDVLSLAWSPHAQLLVGGGAGDGRRGFVTLWKGGAASK